ncbi:NPCBM/NEW2 domain-containing protein [Tengunoibacter tsumagoiensis]|uniref:Glycosyl hydrolase family 98 putative carbohydrate-binding module domain-containing protein n=1 Tax=Tengunoibacter tsumagoiensis TaxID=2014871 RepID=A0A401ZUD4_9CHLR|nr:NPCBM/NEW2 domain-containing protein [Tengunoibacter tsumagoiensis]GCE10473.1 hypothetical protein KTT_03320 [Tengunoibacter tsumagoiensis]
MFSSLQSRRLLWRTGPLLIYLFSWLVAPALTTVSARPQEAFALPGSYQSADIGTVQTTGTADYQGTTFTVSGSGSDIWLQSDQFQYVYQPITQDGTYVARVASQTAANAWAKSGIMFRDSLDPNAAYALMALTPGFGAAFQWRSATGATSLSVNITSNPPTLPPTDPPTISAPYYVKLIKQGNLVQGLISSDGTNFTKVSAATVNFTSSSIYVGLVVTAHDNSLTNTSTFDDVQFTAASTSSGSLPSPFQTQDIGSVGPTGIASYANGTYALSGSGTDVWNTSDQFRYVYQPLSGDGQIVARVASQENTGGGWAKAGVMIRETLDPSSAYAFAMLTPENGANFQWRTASDIPSTGIGGPSAFVTPYWLKLTREGNLFTAYASSDANTYTVLGTTIIPMANSVEIGLAVNSHDNTQINTSTFDNVTVSNVTATATQTPTPSPTSSVPTPTPTPSISGGALPTGYQAQDIGSVAIPGEATYDSTSNTFNTFSSGTDIWNSNDQFQYIYQTLTGDGSIVARVASQANTGGGWAKAGVMMRETLDPSSAHAFMMLSPGYGTNFQWRPSASSPTFSLGGSASTTAPYWVKLTRTGNFFTGSTSSDGVTYTTVGSVNIPMGSSIYVGLASTSHDNANANITSFDNVAITGSTAPSTTPTTTPTSNGPLPSPYQTQDVGAVNIAGSATYDSSNSTFTLKGSGTDVWDVSDAFRYAYQPINGDATIIAHVLSQDTTGGGWAKAGVMIRESLTSSSAQAMVLLAPSYGANFQWRASAGGTTVSQTGDPSATVPYWVQLTRSGNLFTASTSSDGTTYTQIGTATIPMGSSVYVGLFDNSHDNSLLNTARFDNVSITNTAPTPTPTPTITPSPTPTPSPVPFTGTYLSDLTPASATAGFGSVEKDLSVNLNPLTLRGRVYPKGIGTHAISEIHYTLNGNYSRFLSDVGVDDETGSAGTVDFQVYGDNTLLFDSGVVAGGAPVQTVDVNVAGVNDLNLLVTDAGDGITSDHADWADARLTGSTVTPTPSLPTGITNQDIGTVGAAGSASYDSGTGTFTVQGSGEDIWQANDAFHFVYTSLTGDGEIIARVVSQDNTNAWAKSGVMMRDTLNSDSLFAMQMLTPGNGAVYQWRDTSGPNAQTTTPGTETVPYWVKLVRSGDVFTGYASSDGVNYTQVTSRTIPMGSTIYAGLEVTSHSYGTLNTSTFDNVSISNSTTIQAKPHTAVSAQPLPARKLSFTVAALPVVLNDYRKTILFSLL